MRLQEEIILCKDRQIQAVLCRIVLCRSDMFPVYEVLKTCYTLRTLLRTRSVRTERGCNMTINGLKSLDDKLDRLGSDLV